MVGQDETATNAAAGDAATQETPARTRQRSTIRFPYMDLSAAIELAQAIHGNVGLGECDDDQLAAWSKQSVKSSTFRVQIYTARTFGILEGEGARHKLSAVGQAIVDPNRARQARANAFLAVPLFKAVYENYKGTVLPPAAALERDIAALGVAEKQKGRARQTFERSADQAGFFEHGKNHLVMPGAQANAEPPKQKEEDNRVGGGGGQGGGQGGGDHSDLHPFIQGLLETLPEPESDWSVAARAKWLQTAANIFDLIYKGEGGIKIEAAMAQRSPRPDAD